MIATPSPTTEEVRVEPITDDDREQIRELLLQAEHLMERES